MPKKGYTPEQIIHKLREAEILLSQGNTIGITVKRLALATSRITVGEKNTAGCVLIRLAGSRNWSGKTVV